MIIAKHGAIHIWHLISTYWIPASIKKRFSFLKHDAIHIKLFREFRKFILHLHSLLQQKNWSELDSKERNFSADDFFLENSSKTLKFCNWLRFISNWLPIHKFLETFIGFEGTNVKVDRSQRLNIQGNPKIQKVKALKSISFGRR